LRSGGINLEWRKFRAIKKRNSQDFPAAGFRWNVKFNSGENTIKVVAKKGKITVTDEIKQNYQTENGVSLH